ncbi:MAG TPA: hypothetical protein VH089_10920 [Streptosporangiaceae bacterium]|nr:hypothetical protein [Streptosporangiaceae bacterium]
MSSDLWFGAVTTLAGAVLGGAISFVLNRQQIKAARTQRAEDFSRQEQRHSEDRRYDVYADFMTKVRSFRNAIRPLGHGQKLGPGFTAQSINALAESAHTTSSLVFLVVESPETYEVTRAIVSMMSRAQGFLNSVDLPLEDDPWPGLNDEMAGLLREFQVTTRAELGIGGVDRRRILDRS